MNEALAASVQAMIDEGRCETVAGMRLVPLLALESETRIAIAEGMRWVAVPPDERPPFVYGPGTEQVLLEAIETPRRDFEQRLEEAARKVGLPAEEACDAFPYVGVVRAVLATTSPYLVRLALLWLRPTELRELREDLGRVARSPALPTVVKDLAAHLVVAD